MITITPEYVALAILGTWNLILHTKINDICAKCPYFPPNRAKLEIELKQKEKKIIP